MALLAGIENCSCSCTERKEREIFTYFGIAMDGVTSHKSSFYGSLSVCVLMLSSGTLLSLQMAKLCTEFL